jgi:aminoglycoside/choline kinase family phosphotransferase
MSDRQSEFEHWLKIQCQQPSIALRSLAKDASFRRYYALEHDPAWLAVDAPPEHEKNHEFVAVAEAFARKGVRVPAIKAYDLDRGFLLVENLGRDSYLQILKQDPSQADRLYKEAILKLVDIASVDDTHLLHFDRSFLQAELDYFTEWFLEAYLGCKLSTADRALLDQTYETLILSATAQPQICIHRDYHSRNLIVREQDNPGVIDFQDAMLGPLSYDLVSLLRDAYIDWPREQVEAWAQFFYEAYRAAHPQYTQSWSSFLDDFNLMGVQRHLKAIFIFARKWLRDQDPGYLDDIPRTLNYIFTIADEYPSLHGFCSFLQHEVQPKLEALA